MKSIYFPVILLFAATPLVAQDNSATQMLTEQAKQFEQQIVKVADKVHVAVGYTEYHQFNGVQGFCNPRTWRSGEPNGRDRLSCGVCPASATPHSDAIETTTKQDD